MVFYLEIFMPREIELELRRRVLETFSKPVDDSEGDFEVTQPNAEKHRRLEVVKNQSIFCGDPKRSETTPPHFCGPAVFGGLWGLAAVSEGTTFESRVDDALIRLKRAGYRSAIHGNKEDGLKGCRLFRALAEGRLNGHCPIPSIEEAEYLALKYDVGYCDLEGTHDARAIVLNTRPDTTILAKRQKYVVDVWVYREFGVGPEVWLPHLYDTAKLLLRKGNRRIIMPY